MQKITRVPTPQPILVGWIVTSDRGRVAVGFDPSPDAPDTWNRAQLAQIKLQILSLGGTLATTAEAKEAAAARFEVRP